MGNVTFLSVLFVSIPEEIMILLLGIFSIGKFDFFRNSKSNYIRGFLFAVITAIISYFVRRAVSNETENLLVSLLIGSLLFIFIIRLKFYESILAILFAFTIFIITEAFSLMSVAAITGISLDASSLNDTTRILLSLPERILQAAMLYLSWRFKIKILDLESANLKRKEYYLQLFVYLISIGALVFLAVIMLKTLLFDRDTVLTQTDSVLLRINVYLSLFVTIILSLAIRSTSEHYKNKNMLTNNELLQSLDYISNLLQENEYKEAKDSINTLKEYVTKQ